MLSIPPATDVPVLVPWRTDNGPREQIWRRLQRDVWAGWRVVASDHDGTAFSRAAARNQAARQAGDWQVAILADADSIVPPGRLHAAIDLALSSGRMVIAHDRWVNVRPDEQADFLTSWCVQYTPEREVFPLTVGSMLVVPRAVWDAVGGQDERMTGYGYEDNAFHRACAILTGDPLRLSGSVWHFADDPVRPTLSEQLRSPDTRRNRDLWQRYRRVTTPAAMRALLAERP